MASKDVVVKNLRELCTMIETMDDDKFNPLFFQRVDVQLQLINDCVLYVKQMMRDTDHKMLR